MVSVHKPLGILILILVAIRLVNRLLNPAPRLPQGMPAWQRFAAHASHFVLYALMFALPLDLTRIGALEPDVGDRQEPGWTEREEDE